MSNICGVDVSKTMLDAFVASSGRHARFGNDAEGIAALADLCAQEGVDLVVMEATGHHHPRAYLLLWQAGGGSLRDRQCGPGALSRAVEGPSGEDGPAGRGNDRQLCGDGSGRGRCSA